MRSKQTPKRAAKARDARRPLRKARPQPATLDAIRDTVERQTGMIVRLAAKLDDIVDVLARLEPIGATDESATDAGVTELEPAAAPAGEDDEPA